MAGLSRRALHFVLKLGNRRETMDFFQATLGMTVLRHEEFEEGCKASCNGPYDGRWSKTMIGYGGEDNHFVCELTYNYGIGNYRMGNDFQGLTICSDEVLEKVSKLSSAEKTESGYAVSAPGGYNFNIQSTSSNTGRSDPVRVCSLSSTDLQRSYDYWVGLLDMNVIERTDDKLVIQYQQDQCRLKFIKINEPMDHAKTFGRVAFSCPTEQLPGLEQLMKEKGETILTPYVSLDTPGKATVHVVILADPDGHEICFVGDEAFRALSQVDPAAPQLLEEALNADKSDEWYAKKKKTKLEEN